jgi:dephospho-CoA kinase
LEIREICGQQRWSNEWVHAAKLGFSCDIRGMASHKIVGLTGGMASGKSTVRKMFEALGVPAWDADRAGHAVYRKHPALRMACAERWGAQVLAGQNDVQRNVIAAIVFADAGELQWLNAQVHPLVRADFHDWLATAGDQAPYVIRESAILFEAGFETDCDAVVCVSAPEADRLARAVQRDGMSAEEARMRMKKQLTDTERNKRCQFVIDNGAAVTLSDLSTNVAVVHQLLIESLT